MEPRAAGPRARLAELWHHRRLASYFGRRGVERLYARTKLGRAWLFIRPVMDLGTRAVIFGGILVAPSNGIPYLVFLAVGTVIWMLFERGMLWVTRSIEMNRRLVSQIYFPRLTLWASSVWPSFAEFALYALVAAAIVGVVSAKDGDLYLNVDPELLLALPAVLLCVAVVLGVGLWTSVLGASTRDMRFTVRYATGFIYFLTPVVYPLSAVPDQFEPIVAWNPLTPIVEMFRLALLGSGEVQAGPLVLCVGLIVASWAGGLAFYSRWEAGAVDRL